MSRAWLPVILAGACAAAGFLAGTPYALLDAPTFLDYMQAWRVRGTTGVVFAPPDEPQPLVAMATAYLPEAMGWPAFVLALTGIGLALVRRPAWMAPYAAYGLILVLFLAQSKQVTPRYPIPLYPLLALLAAWTVAELVAYLQRNGMRLAAIVAGLGLLLAALSGPAVTVVDNDVALTLPDTRTLMKLHIERTIPPETKILMDPFCPPLAQSRRLLTQLYQRAVAENHPRGEQFRLRLATLPPVTYEWYWTKHEKSTALPRDQAWSDAMIPYIAIADGIDAVRAQGVRYVVISSLNRDAYRTPWHRHLYPEIGAFYDAVEAQGTLLRREAPARGVAQGPRLELYDIGVRR